MALLPSTVRSDSRTTVTAPSSRSFTAYSVRPSGCTARNDGSPAPPTTPAPVIRPVTGSYVARPMPSPPPSTEVYVPRYSGRGPEASRSARAGRSPWPGPAGSPRRTAGRRRRRRAPRSRRPSPRTRPRNGACSNRPCPSHAPSVVPVPLASAYPVVDHPPNAREPGSRGRVAGRRSRRARATRSALPRLNADPPQPRPAGFPSRSRRKRAGRPDSRSRMRVSRGNRSRCSRE